MIKYILLFFIYSFLGWIMEVIQGLILNKKFVNRGFLIGPCCSIYGYGVLLITICLSHLKPYPISLFFLCILICGNLEYLTSYFMEKLFHARWWDYSKDKININGRICLRTLTSFGLLGLLIIYILNPFFLDLLGKMSHSLLVFLSVILVFLYVIDNIISLNVVKNIKITASSIKDNTEEITEKVKEILLKQSMLTRRLINAFPNIKIIDVRKKIIEEAEKLKNKISDLEKKIEK